MVYMRNLILSAAFLFILNPCILLAYCEGGKYPNITVAEELQESQLVVIGEVTSRMIVVDPIEDPEGYEAEIFKFKIEETLVGPSKKEISLYNVNTSARFPMDVGMKYFIFVRKDDDGYWVNSCGNSDEYDKSAKIILEVKKLLKKAHNQGDTPVLKPAR